MPPHRRRHRRSGGGSGHRRRRNRDDEEAEEERDGGGEERNEGQILEQTKACDPEWIVEMRAYLGEPNKNRTRCFLCKAARHDSALVQMEPWNEMAEIYRKGQLETDPIANAWTLSRHFEVNVRQEANKRLKKGQPPVPAMRAVDIYYHFRMHMLEASNEVFNTIREIKNTEYLILSVLRKPILKADGRPGFAPRKKLIPLLKSIWSEKRQWMSMRPERLCFYNPVYGLNVADVSAFANKNRKWAQINVEDYLVKETSKRTKLIGDGSSGGGGAGGGRGRA